LKGGDSLGYRFEYIGGAIKPDPHKVEKFLLFAVVGGKEIPFYQLKEASLVKPAPNSDKPEYISYNNVMKVFVSQQGFGIRRRFYSFYFSLQSAGNEVTIKPFSGDETGMYFKAIGRFLKNKDAAQLLDAQSDSRNYVAQQGMLPKEVLQKMIVVDRSAVRRNIRAVRIGKKPIT
jgi:hypothetical protein